MENIDDTLKVLKNILEARGHTVELTRNNGNYHLKQYNCPISNIAAEFKNICAYELQLYREVFGEGVTKEDSMSEGSPSCSYKIPAN